MINEDHKPSLEDLGWWRDPKESEKLLLYHERQSFGDMEDAEPDRFCAQPVGQMDEKVLTEFQRAMAEDGIENGSVDLNYMEKVVLGSIVQWRRQLIGSCVASGSFRNIVTRSLVEVALLDHDDCVLGYRTNGTDNVAPYAPYHYGQGRRYAGIRGYGDGSTCNGQIKAFMEKGFLACDAPGLRSDSYPETQDKSRYRDWGAGKYLDEYEQHAIKFDLLESEQIRSGDHMRRKIKQEFKPSMICSSWAFKPDYKHRDGFWVYTRDRGNTWQHNMGISGLRIASDNLEFIKVPNSWGPNAHKDGDHFHVRLDEADTWFKNAMCRSFGDLRLREGKLSRFN